MRWRSTLKGKSVFHLSPCLSGWAKLARYALFPLMIAAFAEKTISGRLSAPWNYTIQPLKWRCRYSSWASRIFISFLTALTKSKRTVDSITSTFAPLFSIVCLSWSHCFKALSRLTPLFISIQGLIEYFSSKWVGLTIKILLTWCSRVRTRVEDAILKLLSMKENHVETCRTREWNMYYWNSLRNWSWVSIYTTR